MNNPQNIWRSSIQTVCLCLTLFVLGFERSCNGDESKDDEPKDDKIVLAEGKIRLAVPKSWTRQKPKFKAIVSDEFRVDATEADKADELSNARVTVGGAGGKFESLLSYWMGQYSQPDGKPTSERTIVKDSKVAGQMVHVVDITGTYKGNQYRQEPRQADFRMLGAIIVTKKLGRYFVKLYGPRRTVAANEKAFQSLVDSLTVQ